MIDWSFHHIGLACRSIDSEVRHARALGYEVEGPLWEDPIQRVRIQFLTGPGPRLELIEPSAPDSPVQGVIARGTKFYHLAWETAAFDAKLEELAGQGYRRVAPPAPAVAFGMRRIVFLLSGTANLIELIEAEPGQGIAGPV